VYLTFAVDFGFRDRFAMLIRLQAGCAAAGENGLSKIFVQKKLAAISDEARQGTRFGQQRADRASR
jgi:hypothetical protein